MLLQGGTRQVVYFKRFRMEIDLAAVPPVPALPAGYSWISWHPHLMDCHADVKYRSFHEEIDGVIFPNLGNRQGCLHLMEEITRRPGFCPDATWLIACGDGHCG